MEWGEFEQALRVKGRVWGKNVLERAAQAMDKMRESRHVFGAASSPK